MASKFKGGSQGGQIASTPLKKAMIWIIVGSLILITLIIMAVYATINRTSGKSLWQSERRAVIHETVSSVHSNVTLTTDWYEVAVPLGMTIHFLPKSKDVYWDVKINDNQIIHRPPINSPEFEEIDYGNNMRLVAWRVPQDQSRKTCEFEYSLHVSG